MAPLTRLLPGLAAVAAVLGWAFLPTLQLLWDKWATDPQYSHGFLVPPFAAYLIYRKWAAGTLAVGPPAPILGVVLLALVGGLRWLAGGLMFHQLDTFAILLSLLAVAVCFGGWRLARSVAPAVLFLAFAGWLPYEVERNVGGPLKTAATQASTYLLQTGGLPAVAEGNTILIDDHTLEVADACSGIKMLLTFAAFAAGAVLLLDRTRFEKLLVLLGIVPIAVAVNVLRVTATGVAHATTDPATVAVLHDAFGYLMMPAGLALLAAQLWALGRLVVRDDEPAAGFVALQPA